jgi:hypothetical protein
MPEVEVLAHHHQACPQPVDQLLLYEVLGRLLGPGQVEGDDHGPVDAAGRQELELLLQVGELERGGLGPHHTGRVSIEGDHHGGEPTRLGARRKITQQGPMAQVHAVVGADRHGSSGHRARG